MIDALKLLKQTARQRCVGTKGSSKSSSDRVTTRRGASDTHYLIHATLWRWARFPADSSIRGLSRTKREYESKTGESRVKLAG